MAQGWRQTLLQILSPSGNRARLLVLTFHQVPREPDALLPGIASSTQFEAQMGWLSDFCNVLPLSDAVQHLSDGTLPARAASITFDDGYRDNLEVAVPILQKLRLPATFFVTSGAIERGIMWNDLVIEGARRANADLDLQDLGLGRYLMSSVDEKKTAFRSLIDQIKYRSLAERMEITETVYSRATDEPEPRLMMSRQQVAELAGLGFEVGAHTVSHPILGKLPTAAAKQEIEQSHRWVADVTGIAPRAFAYPNGRFGTDFTTAHEDQVREAGFELAVSTDWGAATAHSRLTAIPRFAPWERNRSGYWLRLVKTLLQSYQSR